MLWKHLIEELNAHSVLKLLFFLFSHTTRNFCFIINTCLITNGNSIVIQVRSRVFDSYKLMKIFPASSVHDLNSIKFQNVIGFLKNFYVARGIDVVGRPIQKGILSLAKVFCVHCRSRPGLPILAS